MFWIFVRCFFLISTVKFLRLKPGFSPRSWLVEFVTPQFPGGCGWVRVRLVDPQLDGQRSAWKRDVSGWNIFELDDFGRLGCRCHMHPYAFLNWKASGMAFLWHAWLVFGVASCLQHGSARFMTDLLVDHGRFANERGHSLNHPKPVGNFPKAVVSFAQVLTNRVSLPDVPDLVSRCSWSSIVCKHVIQTYSDFDMTASSFCTSLLHFLWCSMVWVFDCWAFSSCTTLEITQVYLISSSFSKR